MQRLQVCLTAAVLVVLAGVSPAFAQGYGVYEQGACAMARAGTGVAAPCADGSGVFFNPATIALFKTQELSVGATLIRPKGNFTDAITGQVSSLNNRTYPVPSVYYARRLNKKFALGFGVFAPYGLTTDWPVTSEGRYLGYKSLVQGIYLQPTVAYKVNDNLAFGAGIDLAHVSVELRQRTDLSTVAVAPGLTFGTLPVGPVPVGTDFVDTQLKGSAWHVGYHLGMYAKFGDQVSIGVRYMSGQNVGITNGKVTNTQIMTGLKLQMPLSAQLPAGTPIDTMVAPNFVAGQKLSNQDAQTAIPLPAQVVLGYAYHFTPKVMAEVDYQFTRWSSFKQLVITQQYGPTLTNYESYKDTHGLRFGFEYGLGKKSALRAGFLAHTAAAPDQTVTPNLPEAPRREVTVGFGTWLANKLRVDFAYQYLYQLDRLGRTTNGGLEIPTAAVNNGTYHFNGHLFAIGVGF
jgi:long-chain fatty acid transport protein